MINILEYSMKILQEKDIITEEKIRSRNRKIETSIELNKKSDITLEHEYVDINEEELELMLKDIQ